MFLAATRRIQTGCRTATDRLFAGKFDVRPGVTYCIDAVLSASECISMAMIIPNFVFSRNNGRPTTADYLSVAILFGFNLGIRRTV
jgi:hypothetical protein